MLTRDETELPSPNEEAVSIMQSPKEVALPLDWRPSVDLGPDHAAVDTLSSLWPAEISCCPEFVKHILHAKGLGSVEVGLCHNMAVCVPLMLWHYILDIPHLVGLHICSQMY